MKYLSSTLLGSLLRERDMRRNVRALLKYLAFLTAVIVVYAVLFHFIMWYVEGERHSWLTGLYWTLTVMSTLGFGDITFTSDLGRAFSVVVLVSGIVLLLVLLPFVFIRYFYAPWLEAQVRIRAPREVPEGTRDHVVIASFDSIAQGLVDRLKLRGIPYFVLEPDPARASRMRENGVSVVTGELDDHGTFERLRAPEARLILANATDAENANLILSIRAVAPDVPLAAVASVEEAVDVLELAGATQVLPLKRRLGEHLANRINAGHAEAHVIGSFRELLIAEFSVHNTPLAGRTLRDSRIREATGVNVVGVWEGARLVPAGPDTRLGDTSLPLVVGGAEEIERLNELLVIYDAAIDPVLVIGGGKVGRSATRALKRKGVAVHMIEKNETLRDRIGDLPDRLFLGDASERHLLMRAGLETAPSVLLTTNEDATNIYLAVYCRRLNPEVRIVSRITHERNVTAIRRAGVDLALSYAALGVETVMARLEGRDLVFLGEGVELHRVAVGHELVGKTLAESGIRARTGLNVIGVEDPSGRVRTIGPDTRLETGCALLMIGSPEELQAFLAAYR